MSSPSEFAPVGRKVRVTKQQLRQIQENYRIAQLQAQDNKEKEAQMREKELAFLEAELDAVPENFVADQKLQDTEKIQKILLDLLSQQDSGEVLTINRYLGVFESFSPDFVEKFELLRKEKNILLKELFLGVKEVKVNHLFESEEEKKYIKIIADTAFTSNFIIIANTICEYDMKHHILTISKNQIYLEKMKQLFQQVWEK